MQEADFANHFEARSGRIFWTECPPPPVQSAPLDSEKFAKHWEKKAKSGKKRGRGKNLGKQEKSEKEEKSGRNLGKNQ